MPMGVERFPGQREGEKVKLIVEKHWIIYLRMLKQFLIFAIVPFMAMFFFTADTPSNIRYIVYLVSLMYLSYYFLVMFIGWLDEMLDIIVVTNQRIISIEQVNLFQNTASETNLPMIQDVKGRKKGILGGIFHFGEIEIQTAGEKIAFHIQDVGKPFTKAKAILFARDQYIAQRGRPRDGVSPPVRPGMPDCNPEPGSGSMPDNMPPAPPAAPTESNIMGG